MPFRSLRPPSSTLCRPRAWMPDTTPVQHSNPSRMLGGIIVGTAARSLFLRSTELTSIAAVILAFLCAISACCILARRRRNRVIINPTVLPYSAQPQQTVTQPSLSYGYPPPAPPYDSTYQQSPLPYIVRTLNFSGADKFSYRLT